MSSVNLPSFGRLCPYCGSNVHFHKGQNALVCVRGGCNYDELLPSKPKPDTFHADAAVAIVQEWMGWETDARLSQCAPAMQRRIDLHMDLSALARRRTLGNF